MAENFQPDKLEKPWHKTIGGIIFLSIFSLIILGVVVFMAFFSYYAWQIKYGSLADKTKLEEQFAGGFTVDGSLAQKSGNSQTAAVDFEKYIKNSDPQLGIKNAPITILAFVDFECPYSRESYSAFKTMTEKYESVIRVVFKNLPLVDLHPNALPAAQAVLCAHEENKFLQYYDSLLTNQDLSSEGLTSRAKNLGLDISRFQDCLASGRHNEEIMQDTGAAADLGLIGTPTYLVNGQKVQGVVTAEEWNEIVLQFLNK